MINPLQTSEEVQNLLRFKVIFDYSPNPMLVFDTTGILECNEAAVEILGSKNKEDLLYKHPASFSPEMQPDGLRSQDKAEIMVSLASSKEFHRFEWIHKKLDGKEFPVEVTLSRIPWGTKQAILSQWSDLTQKMEMDQIKQGQASKMESVETRLGEIAHEINNPLGVMSITLDSLPRYVSDPAKLTSKLEMLGRSVLRITKITSTLKRLSQLKRPSEYEKHSLEGILNKALATKEAELSQNQVILILDIQSKAEILCDLFELEQVLVSLINNSMKAIKDLPEKWIKISLQDRNHGPLFQLIDSGKGIPQELSQKIFSTFSNSKPLDEGNDLSLTVIKILLERQNAEIALLSNQPNTSFEIKFSKA